MTDTSGRSLLSMAEEVGRAQARYHPGRPAFSALSRAQNALREAAQEVAAAAQAYGPSGRASGR